LGSWLEQFHSEFASIDSDTGSVPLLSAIWEVWEACAALNDIEDNIQMDLDDAQRQVEGIAFRSMKEEALKDLEGRQAAHKAARRELKNAQRKVEDCQEGLELNDSEYTLEDLEGLKAKEREAQKEVQCKASDLTEVNQTLWELQESFFPELLEILETTADSAFRCKIPAAERAAFNAKHLPGRQLIHYGQEAVENGEKVVRGAFAGKRCRLKKMLMKSHGMAAFQTEVQWLLKFNNHANNNNGTSSFTVPLQGFFIDGKYGCFHFDDYPANLQQWAVGNVGLEASKFLGVVLNVLRAVEYIHSANFFHGNMKPANILMDDGDHPLLCDFEYGFQVEGAKVEQSASEMYLKVGAKRAFPAPELQKGQLKDPLAIDIFSLGRSIQLILDLAKPEPINAVLSALSELLSRMTCEDPDHRVSAHNAHEWLSNRMLPFGIPVKPQETNKLAPPLNWVMTSSDCTRIARVAVDGMRDEMLKKMRQSDHCRQKPVDDFEIEAVHRIEHAHLWNSYAAKRDSIRAAISAQREAMMGPWPPPLLPPDPAPQMLDASINEVYMFHGCPNDVADSIIQTGFDERLSASSNFYGSGCYFTPQACKALQYSRDKSCSLRRKRCGQLVCRCEGLKYLFYSRIVLGVPFYAPTVDRDLVRPPYQPGQKVLYDSVIANPGIPSKTDNGRQIHREAVVWNHGGLQAYPEYLITLKSRR